MSSSGWSHKSTTTETAPVSQGTKTNPFVVVTLENPMLKSVSVTKCGTVKFPYTFPLGDSFLDTNCGKTSVMYVMSSPVSWLVIQETGL
jgi:hypothetical protein